MSTKNRTIPQLQLSDLSGDCTVCIFDSVTLSAIVELWTVTLYPSTWVDNVYNKTIYDLRKEYGLNSSATQQAIAKRQAILDDFERGIRMGCDINATLQGIVTAINGLRGSVSSLQSAIISTSCCNNGQAGVPDYNQTPTLDDDPEHLSKLCLQLRYAQWLCQSWIDRYITPILALGLTEIIAALSASLIAPPYGTEIAEVSAGIVAIVISFGANWLAEQLEDVIPALFDELYCVLINGELQDEDGIRGWIYDKINVILGNPAVSTVATWIIGASGAMLAIVQSITNVLDVPANFEGEPCQCEGEGGWETQTEYNPLLVVGSCGEPLGGYSAYSPGVVTFTLTGYLPSHRTVRVIYRIYTTLQLGSVTLTVNGESVEISGNECAGEIAVTVNSEIVSATVTFNENTNGSGIDCNILGVDYV